jgi:hypothetical protein
MIFVQSQAIITFNTLLFHAYVFILILK